MIDRKTARTQATVWAGRSPHGVLGACVWVPAYAGAARVADKEGKERDSMHKGMTYSTWGMRQGPDYHVGRHCWREQHGRGPHTPWMARHTRARTQILSSITSIAFWASAVSSEFGSVSPHSVRQYWVRDKAQSLWAR